MQHRTKFAWERKVAIFGSSLTKIMVRNLLLTVDNFLFAACPLWTIVLTLIIKNLVLSTELINVNWPPYRDSKS